MHSDLCGPMRQESLSGAKYFATFIDDATRWCVVKFLKKKSDLTDAFKSYQNMVETQTGLKVKCLQTDNGKEYKNTELDKHLENCGIKRRLTIPHTPEQNGVAERKNRTLVEMARCLMISSNLPSSFWAEAISTANHLRNRCPSRNLNGLTPFKKWTSVHPHLSYLKTFGCKGLSLNK